MELRPKIQKMGEINKNDEMGGNKVKTLKRSDIKVSTARHLVGSRVFYQIDDIRYIELHPQKIEKGYSLWPEASVVVSNTENYFIIIDIARADNGWYYTSYEVHYPMGGSSSWPSTGRGSNAGRTLGSALTKGLEALKEYRRYVNSVPDKRVIEIADRALHKLQESSIYQMNIFDIL